MAEAKLALIADGSDARVRTHSSTVEAEFSRLGYASTLHVADGPRAAREIAEGTLRGGQDLLVAIGGDAHVAEVIEGMFDAGKPISDDAVLGVVPAGAGSDLLKTFSMPTDVAGACRYVASDASYPFDVMKVTFTGEPSGTESRIVATVAQIGFSAGVSMRIGGHRSGTKRFIAYWSELVRTRPVPVRIDADRNRFEGDAWDVVVANTQHAGGLRVSPRSYPGDGVLETAAFVGPRSDALTLLPKVFRNGDHIPHDNIAEQHARIRVSVDADRPLPIVADGRPIGTTPATFQIVPRAFSLKA